MDKELKSCPFCKSEPKLYKVKGGGKVYACPLGHATTGECSDEESARIEWNTRPIEDGLQKEIEQLKDALQLAIKFREGDKESQ